MTDWKNKLAAYLHDPPHKPFRIAGHENARLTPLNELGLTEGDMEAWDRDHAHKSADWQAAAADRFPFPRADVMRVDWKKDEQLSVRHPLAGERFQPADQPRRDSAVGETWVNADGTRTRPNWRSCSRSLPRRLSESSLLGGIGCRDTHRCMKQPNGLPPQAPPFLTGDENYQKPGLTPFRRSRVSRPSQGIGAHEEVAGSKRRRAFLQEHSPHTRPGQSEPWPPQRALLGPHPSRRREVMLRGQ